MQLNNNNSTHSKVTLFLDFILFNELFFHQKNPDEENRKKKTGSDNWKRNNL
jgi:hypothetical protein